MIDQRQQIRTAMRQKRQTLDKVSIAACSKLICHKVMRSPIFQQAEHIAFYQATRGEVDPALLIKLAQKNGQHCYLPIVEDSCTLTFGEFTATTPLKLNRWQIAEPQTNNIIPADQLDLIIVPLLAFNHSNHRLGYGSGYYDRCLKCAQNVHRFGLAYHWQYDDSWQPESHDMPMDRIFTEKTKD